MCIQQMSRGAMRSRCSRVAPGVLGFLAVAATCLSLCETAQAGDAGSHTGLDEEAQQVLQECKGAMQFSMYHDCDCVQARFKEARPQHMQREIKVPAGYGKFHMEMREIPAWEVKHMVKNRCLNKEGIVAYHYKNCSRTMRNRRNDVEVYCKCVSEDIAEAYIAKPDETLNPIYINKLTVAAYGHCGVVNQ